MTIAIIKRSFANLLLPGVLKVLLFCVLGYILSWGALAWGIAFGISQYFGIATVGSLATHVFSSVFGMAIAWFLFPLLYPILVSFFIDGIARSIEKADYPGLPEAQPPFWPSLRQDIMFSLKAIGLNLLCLPLYFIPLVNIAVYYSLNGYLLGKQFFLMASGRRVNLAEADKLLGSHRNTVFALGVAMMVCATLPLIGLVAPVLGVAIMLHLFHHLNGTAKVTVLPPQ